MSTVSPVGPDVHLNTIAAVWGKSKRNARTLGIRLTGEGYRALIEARRGRDRIEDCSTAPPSTAIEGLTGVYLEGAAHFTRR